MHDIKEATAVALPRILDWIDEENARREAAHKRRIRIIQAPELAAERINPDLRAWLGIPPDAEGWAYGCEFEPVMNAAGRVYSRDHLQSFKNEIYDIGVDIGARSKRSGQDCGYRVASAGDVEHFARQGRGAAH